jgi:adenosylcobinamide-phosphate synthase
VRAAAAGIGILTDAALGEPPLVSHPVARFGALMERVEQRTYAPRRLNGTMHLAAGLAIACSLGVGLRRLTGSRLSSIIAVAACSAGRMLDAEAKLIGDHLIREDIDQARHRLPALAGRDPSRLDSTEISRAVIESLAENGVDAVTATMVWGTIGGAPAVLAHRAVNTLDAMVGHRNDRYEQFGWAAARLDDVLNYIPARVTMLAVAIARPRRAREVLRITRRDAPKHPSPNGGVVEAAFAAALGVRLGGANNYGGIIDDRGTLGDGRAPAPSDIAGAIRLRRDSTAVVLCLLLTAELILSPRRARTTRRAAQAPLYALRELP